ncbi:MAG TPA: WecB/TagA/CpsF family glycosyltransferase [Solirubrobacteraceae bacterium]|nr:WecB/TagA/CpsF family glycosyltransferase [Solirubrobacteraceae bacterium]
MSATRQRPLPQANATVRSRPDRAHVLGCPLDRVDLERAVAYCERVIERRGFAQHMAINAAKLVAMRSDSQLREAVERCELITADGQSIVWASRLLGDPLPCRVAGIDLMRALLSRAAARGFRVYILGASRETLALAVARIREEHPTLTIAGFHDGYYEDAEEERIAAEIAAARPDILFVAISSPRKEYFLARHGRRIGAPFVMGVGGAIDVQAGIVRRAPLAMQRLGLEWLFRLAQEPRRLAGRYARTNARFGALVAAEVVRARLRPGGRRAGA